MEITAKLTEEELRLLLLAPKMREVLDALLRRCRELGKYEDKEVIQVEEVRRIILECVDYENIYDG